MSKDRIKIKNFSWLNPKVEIRRHKKYGKGIFTRVNIKKGEIISIFGGRVISRKDENKLPKKIRDIGMQISEKHVLGIRSESELEPASFFNHSCDPNSGIKGQLFLVAMKNIPKNKEITFDYGTVLYKSKGIKPYKLKCLCGSPNCRKLITDSDWKKSDLQKKYKGYFQFYLQEKIKKIKK